MWKSGGKSVEMSLRYASNVECNKP